MIELQGSFLQDKNKKESKVTEEYDDDHPEVIRAKAEAEAKVLEARSRMHPAAQAVYAVFDSLGNLISTIGCLFIILIAILLFFGAPLLEIIKTILAQ